MEIRDLYLSLKEAYTAENLHQISSRIISLFQEKRYDGLRAIQRVVNEYVPLEEDKANRIFSRMIKLYHPDRLQNAIRELEAHYRNDDFESLWVMSHILHVKNLEPDQVAVSEVFSDEDLNEEFGWDGEEDGYSYFSGGDSYGAQYTGQPDGDEEEEEGDGPSFLTALKRRVYGNLNVDFPMYLLEDLEEVEMADYELESLDGIDACRQARVVDLSNNLLTDISDLKDLRQLERLYLANNQIGYIDVLGNLPVLQEIDLSYNDVDDISPLFDLQHLDYLNVMGNRVPAWQLEELQKKGVTLVV